MFLKFSTIEEAEKARVAQQKLLPTNHIICPPISTWDGKFAIPKDIEFESNGELVESIEPLVEEI
ncbi:MAG: hypothetical protein ABFC57_16130 [Veillonellales bacterium]